MTDQPAKSQRSSPIINSELARSLRDGSSLRNSVVDVVFAALIEAIHTRQLPQGTRVSDNELAKELGVSRTPVREALQRMREMALVDTAPNRYTRIVTVDRPMIRNALQVWAGLYNVVLTDTLSLIGDSAISRMEQSATRFSTAVSKGNAVASARANYELYNELVVLSNNAYLVREIEGVVHIVWLGGISVARYVDTDLLSAAHHALIAALRSRDIDAARHAIEMAVASCP